MVGLYIDRALSTSTFTTKATYTHLVFRNLTLHFILNGFDALTTPGLFIENTDFQCITSNFALKFQKQGAILIKNIHFTKSSIAKIIIDIAEGLEQFIEFFCDRLLQFEVQGVFLQSAGLKGDHRILSILQAITSLTGFPVSIINIDFWIWLSYLFCKVDLRSLHAKREKGPRCYTR